MFQLKLDFSQYFNITRLEKGGYWGKKRGKTGLKLKRKIGLKKSNSKPKSFVSKEHNKNLSIENWHCNSDFWSMKQLWLSQSNKYDTAILLMYGYIVELFRSNGAFFIIRKIMQLPRSK